MFNSTHRFTPVITTVVLKIVYQSIKRDLTVGTKIQCKEFVIEVTQERDIYMYDYVKSNYTYIYFLVIKQNNSSSS